MATLELGIDARPMVQGAQQAQQALDGVAKAAQKTTTEVEKTTKAAADAGKAVSQSGAAMRAAFQATGGSIQVAGGIAQTAKAFGELNIAAAAFGSSRALLEIGKTIQDFKELGATVGKTSSIFATLGMVVRANPLLTIATVLGSIGSLMSIFSDNTKKATSSFNELAAAMEKARLSERARAALGLPVTRQGQADVIGQAMERSLAGDQFNLQQFGRGGLGGGADVARYLVAQGTPAQQAAAREYLQTGGYTLQTYNVAASGPYASPSGKPLFVPGLPNVALTPTQTQDVLRMRYESLTAQPAAAPAAGGMAGGSTFGSFQGGVDTAFKNALVSAQLIQEYERRKVEAAKQTEENMRRAADYAANIGGQLGSAFADVLMKTTTLRQAFASIVASIARQSLSDIGASVFRGAVSGLTPRQTAQNAGVTP